MKGYIRNSGEISIYGNLQFPIFHKTVQYRSEEAHKKAIGPIVAPNCQFPTAHLPNFFLLLVLQCLRFLIEILLGVLWPGTKSAGRAEGQWWVVGVWKRGVTGETFLPYSELFCRNEDQS